MHHKLLFTNSYFTKDFNMQERFDTKMQACTWIHVVASEFDL
jgi:hypothetical protein